jgi:acyl dehydratase
MCQKSIGLEGPSVTTEVSKRDITRFAEAIGDDNPAWNNESAARKTRLGGLVAPPTFLRSVGMVRPEFPFDMPFRRRLDGGSDWVYGEPVRPGDQITAVARITDLTERVGRLGLMLFVTTDINYTNQLGDVVATQTNALILY